MKLLIIIPVYNESENIERVVTDTLALSVFAITVELASRFLDDYIVGDKYFNIDYPTHNLVRARCQIALAKDVHEKLTAMQAFIDGCC